jgi:glycogen operon protein
MRIRLASLLFLGIGLAVCKSDPTPHLYASEGHAPSLNKADIGNLEHLGATLIDQGANFGVYSERAERVELLLFDDPEDSLPVQRFKMTRFQDVWNVYVEGVGYGQHYGFVAWGPNWPYEADFTPGSLKGFVVDVDGEGNRFNPNKLLFDPYGKALHREHDWLRASLGTGESRRSESTWGAATKSVISRTEHAWSQAEATWRAARKADTLEGHKAHELVLYEVHPKGFTMNGLQEVEHPGTFQGIAEMAPYLQDLGVTAVELLPVHEKPVDGGYWGYNNTSFFALELDYAAAWTERGRPDLVVDEFKAMVDILHQHGIEVFVDVVYNHTGEGGLWREKLFYNDYSPDAAATSQAVNLDSIEVVGLYSLRGLDNFAYYALNSDGLTYWNNTGVGNQTRPNHEPMSRLIMDSLHYMIEELHVDGFRFDLAGILGEEDLNYNNWYGDPTESLLGTIADDALIQEHNVRIIAEPWTAGGNYNPVLGAYPSSTTLEGFGWSEWNGHFRDIVRAMINDGGFRANAYEGAINFGSALTGSYEMYAWNGRKPLHSVNFVTSHDGFPLYDLFSFDSQQNGCGVLNPTCCDDPYSQWCDRESGERHNRSKDWGASGEDHKRQLMRNAFAALFLSHGTPMLYGGDEWMRTQYGNNNAYSTTADNEFNWFRWGEWRAYDERHRMKDFVAEMAAFRREAAYAIAPAEWGAGMSMAWKNANNSDLTDWSTKHLMQHYYADGGSENAELVVLWNFETTDVSFALPSNRDWRRVVDTQAYFDSDAYLEGAEEDALRKSANVDRFGEQLVGGEYTAKAQSVVVLMEVQ